MQLVGLVEAEDHVCCRYRLAALRPPLAAAGHALTFRPLPRSWAGRLALGRGLAHADAVILQRLHDHFRPGHLPGPGILFHRSTLSHHSGEGRNHIPE